MSSDDYKFYIALVCVQTQIGYNNLRQNNEVFYGWFRDERTAMGDAILRCSEMHPKGVIVFQMINDATNQAQANPNA